MPSRFTCISSPRSRGEPVLRPFAEAAFSSAQTRTNRVEEGRFHAANLLFLLAADVHFDEGASGNRVHLVSAFNFADVNVVRGFAGRCTCRNREMPRANALIGFGVPKSDQLWPPAPFTTISMRRAASACVITYSVDSAVHGNHGLQARAIFFDETAHAAQISVTFFTDIRGKSESALSCDPRFRRFARARATSEASPTPLSEIPGARRMPFSRANVDFGTGGENRVQVSREQHHFPARARPFADRVSEIV